MNAEQQQRKDRERGEHAVQPDDPERKLGTEKQPDIGGAIDLPVPFAVGGNSLSAAQSAGETESEQGITKEYAPKGASRGGAHLKTAHKHIDDDCGENYRRRGNRRNYKARHSHSALRSTFGGRIIECPARRQNIAILVHFVHINNTTIAAICQMLSASKRLDDLK